MICVVSGGFLLEVLVNMQIALYEQITEIMTLVVVACLLTAFLMFFSLRGYYYMRGKLDSDISTLKDEVKELRVEVKEQSKGIFAKWRSADDKDDDDKIKNIGS